MELSMASTSCTPFFALIDDESMLMLHGDSVVARARPTPVGV
jgi:hypothetical protein